MANNVNITPGAGSTVATDDVGSGVQVQKFKLDIGAAGASTLWGSAALADATANPVVPKLGTFLSIYNGTTWDRSLSVQGAVDANTGLGVGASGTYRFNGTGWDRNRGNFTATALASAARTGSVNTSAITNYNGVGIILHLNVTAASGTGGLQVIVKNYDSISTNTMQINVTPSAIISSGIFGYEIYPGANTAVPGATTGNVVQRTAAALSRNFIITVIHGDATSYTYSLGYSVIV